RRRSRGRTCASRATFSRGLRYRRSAGQIFRPLLGEFSFEQSGGLADFDHVAVGVPHVAADLCTAIERGCHELGPLRAPLFVTRVYVGDAQVHEAGHCVPGLVVDDRDVGLVGSGATAWVHDHPSVGELDHAWILLQHDLPAEDLGVERAGPSDVSYGYEVGDEEALARGRQVLEVDRWHMLAHVLRSSYGFWNRGRSSVRPRSTRDERA